MPSHVRTPRRRKIWAGYHNEFNASSTLPDIVDLLDATATDLGLNDLSGVTVMRVVGRITMVAGSVGATTPAYETYKIGMAWVDQKVAATSGSALPIPEIHGARDVRWYQQWILSGLEYAAPLVLGTPLQPEEHSTAVFDITNMQRQPASTSKFCLVLDYGGSAEDNTVLCRVDVDIMLALP